MDFTADIREEAEAERVMKEVEDTKNTEVRDEEPEEVTNDSDNSMMSEEEAMWAAYSADDYDNDDIFDDEDRDIEDAFGLGSY